MNSGDIFSTNVKKKTLKPNINIKLSNSNTFTSLPGDVLRIFGHYLEYLELREFALINKRVSEVIFGEIFQKEYGLRYLTKHANCLPIDGYSKTQYYKDLVSECGVKNRVFRDLDGFNNLLNCKHKKSFYKHIGCSGYELLLKSTKIYKNSDKKCLVEGAIEFGHTHILDYHFENSECDPYFGLDFYVTAVEFNQLEVLKYLVNLNSSDLGDLGRAFEYAANFGHKEIVKYLRTRGFANTTEELYEYLKVAAKLGYFELVEYYVDNIFADIKSSEYITSLNNCLDVAISKGHLDIVIFLISKGCNPSIEKIIDAAKNGHLNMIMYLTNIMDLNKYCDAIFISSSEYGHLEIIKYMVEKYKINIHKCDDLAFRLAAKNGKFEVVKYLHNLGSDIHALYDDALCYAAKNGYLDVVIYLHENGANISENDDCAVRWAAASGNIKVVKFLHEKGANIRANNDYALQKAALNKYVDVIIYLLENGSDIRVIDHRTVSYLLRNYKDLSKLPQKRINNILF